jgi:hypothetical protein
LRPVVGAALRRRDPSYRIRLPSGEELQQRQARERKYLLVADGEIEIFQDGNSVTGGSSFFSHFKPNECQTVSAQRRSARARPVARGGPLSRTLALRAGRSSPV